MDSVFDEPDSSAWMAELPRGWLQDYADWQDASCSGSGPSCRALFDDPRAVLSDKRRWPDHVCGQVLTASLVRWSMRRISSRHLDDLVVARRWMDYIYEHETIPVDRSAVFGRVLWQGRHLFPYPPEDRGECRFAALLGAFDELSGNRTHRFSGRAESATGEPETIEEAALIVEGESGETAWALYFLAMATNASDGADRELYDTMVDGLDWRPPWEFAAFTPSRVLMTVEGDPTVDGLVRLYQRATGWWTKAMAGFEIRHPGRPEVDIQPSEIAATFWRIRDEWEESGNSELINHDPTQVEVCEDLKARGMRICPKTARRNLRRAGIPGWPPPRP